MMKNLIIKTVVVLSITVSNLFAGYVNLGLGAGLSSTSSGGVGINALHLGSGLYSYKKYSASLHLNGINIYGIGLDPYGWVKKNLIDNTKEIEDIMRDLATPLSKVGVFTAAYINLEYDAFDKRGLYYFAGVGYGTQAGFRPEGVDLAKILPTFVQLDGLSNDELFALVQDQSFQQDLLGSLNSINNLITSIYGVDASGIINQINIIKDNPNLIKDEDFLNTWLQDTANIAKDIAGIDQKLDLDVEKAILDNIISFKQGIAWQIGAGYDLKIIGPLGLDTQVKMQGLFVKPVMPVYTVSSSLVFRW